VSIFSKEFVAKGVLISMRLMFCLAVAMELPERKALHNLWQTELATPDKAKCRSSAFDRFL
jgi:hypothetical protein